MNATVVVPNVTKTFLVPKEEEETKEEKVGLFSWLMGKPKVEEQGAEENKNKEKD